MIAGVLGGVFIAHTLYQIVLSYGASGLEVRFSYAFMSPDPVTFRCKDRENVGATRWRAALL